MYAYVHTGMVCDGTFGVRSADCEVFHFTKCDRYFKLGLFRGGCVERMQLFQMAHNCIQSSHILYKIPNARYRRRVLWCFTWWIVK